MVRPPALKPGDSELRSRSDLQVDLLEVVPGSTPELCLHIANWSCQLGFLTCEIYFTCTCHQSLSKTEKGLGWNGKIEL